MAEEAELVVPFVVCKSEGGPHDDKAFVDGYRFGRHHAELMASPGILNWGDFISPEMVPQYDLMAMDFKFVMTIQTHDCDEGWVFVLFSRPEESEDPDVPDH